MNSYSSNRSMPVKQWYRFVMQNSSNGIIILSLTVTQTSGLHSHSSCDSLRAHGSSCQHLGHVSLSPFNRNLLTLLSVQIPQISISVLAYDTSPLKI